jgi:hypothetical protein
MSTARLKSGADHQQRVSCMLGAPRPAAATLWRGLLSIVSCREIGRDVLSAIALAKAEGFAKSGFRPTARWGFGPLVCKAVLLRNELREQFLALFRNNRVLPLFALERVDNPKEP